MSENSDRPESGTTLTVGPFIIGMSAPPPSIYSSHFLPDDHPGYALIGRVAAEWAQLEHFLDKIIWEMSGLDRVTGSCLTSQIGGHRGKCNAILALAERRAVLDETLKKKFRQLSGKMYDAADKRNRFVHDAWFIKRELGTEESLSQFKSLSEKNSSFGIVSIDTREIDDAISTIRDRVSDIEAIWGILHERLLPSPDKPQK